MKLPKFASLVIGFFALGLYADGARAATFVVTNINDVGVGSLHEAIANANSASGDDTIVFDLPGPGPHSIELTQQLPDVASNITFLNDRAGDEEVTVKNEFPNPPLAIQNIFRIFPAGTNIVIAGLTITNKGGGAFGGGIYNRGSNLTVRNCSLIGNRGTSQGGAIYNEAGSVTLFACTLSDNFASDAGAIRNDGNQNNVANLTLIDCLISENQATDDTGLGGAGIVNIGTTGSANLTVNNCTFSNQIAKGQYGGGAILNFGDTNSGTTTVNITNCSFLNNQARNGGAIYDHRGRRGYISLERCTFSGNSAGANYAGGASSGGGAFAAELSNASVNYCTFVDNFADRGFGGGAIYNSGGMIVNASIFTGNSARSDASVFGGGIFSQDGTMTITNCTLANNSSAGRGGGIASLSLLGSGTLSVENSTLSANTAISEGGGIYSGLGSQYANETAVTISNCTLSGNSANSGGGIFSSAVNDETPGNASLTLANTILRSGLSGVNVVNEQGTFTSQGHNLSDDNGSGLLTGPGDQINTDPKLDSAGLANNGGPTQTIALLPDSPAINAGNDVNAPPRDQRGYVRAGVSDIGAFEFGGTIPVTLANISTRAFVQTGNDVMIGGFIITGNGPKRVILRAIGPSLSLTDKLADPTLELRDSSGLPIPVAFNDNWMDALNKQDIINTGLAPTNNLESAILISLNPGAYTAILRGANDGTGIALVEGYDLDRTAGSKLGNISTRAFVQTGNNVMIGGFIVTGPDSDTVVVRALGPSLASAGIVNALQDPILELRDGNGALIASNDNWRTTQEDEIAATGLAPSNDAESAIAMTVTPGAYTGIVRGVNNTTGVALVEVYGLN